ncbi:MAG: helix-hairpin-helix domain-containing protein [Candidatus Helarchaeota archaeon]
MLAGFPDIDSKRAQDLLNYFGSLEEIFNAPIEALMNVKGIGKKIAKQIKEILKAKYF